MASQSKLASSASTASLFSQKKTLSLVETGCVLCSPARPATRPESAGQDYEYETVANEFRFVRCAECDHCFLNPRPASSDLGTIYPSNYYAYAEESSAGVVAKLRRRWEGGKTRLFRELVGEGRRRILDVGCGSGRFLSILRDFGSPDWELEGVDFDEDALVRCEERGFRVHRGRVEDLGADVERFDAIVMLQLIEHVEDPAALSERVFDLLAPGGCFIIETPNLGGVDYALFRGQVWGHYHFPRHWNLFTSAALHRMLVDRGFEIERTDYLISTSAWIVSLHNRAKVRGYPEWAIRFFHFQNPLLLGLFVGFDWLRARLGMQTSNQRVIARRPDPRAGGVDPV